MDEEETKETKVLLPQDLIRRAEDQRAGILKKHPEWEEETGRRSATSSVKLVLMVALEILEKDK